MMHSHDNTTLSAAGALKSTSLAKIAAKMMQKPTVNSSRSRNYLWHLQEGLASVGHDGLEQAFKRNCL